MIPKWATELIRFEYCSPILDALEQTPLGFISAVGSEANRLSHLGSRRRRMTCMQTVLHGGVFREGGRVPRCADELQLALTLSSTVDPAERIPKILGGGGGGGGGVFRRSHLGAERAGCGNEVFGELGRTQDGTPLNPGGIDIGGYAICAGVRTLKFYFKRRIQI